MNMTQLEQWEKLSEQFSIIPLKGKVPIGFGWQKWCSERKPFDAKDFKGKNAGVACGPASGCIVLDVDEAQLFKEKRESQGWVTPGTFTVKTGSGRFHLYYQYPANGHSYGCTSHKGKTQAGDTVTIFDIRGVGGQVVAPGSVHPDTQKPYEIFKDIPLAPCPKWMLDLVTDEVKPTIRPDRVSLTGWEGEIDSLPISEQNKTYILEGANIGERSEVMMSVINALVWAGLKDNDIISIFDGYPIGEKYREKKGGRSRWIMSHLMKAKGYVTDRYEPPTLAANTQHTQQNQQAQHTQQNQRCSASTQQMLSKRSAEISNAQQDSDRQMVADIAGEVREWIRDSTGCFTTAELDREFNLRTRREKNARSSALYILLKKNLILKDRVTKGKYHILSDSIEFIDDTAPTCDHFPINLPLGLNNLVNLPPKSITVVAGTTSSGKTALLLSIAALNLNGDRPLLYLMSEMGRSEFLSRRNKLDVPLEQWKKMKAAERSAGFHAAIWNHNRDGITFVDFLEDVDGEYFKIPSAIREIYDALSDGIAVVAIQKRADATYARGGEGTAEKARLYLSVNLLCECDNFSVCSAKIVKAKDYGERPNPNGKEIHFKLLRGTEIVPITEWQRLSKDDRESLVEQYIRTFHAKNRNTATWSNRTGKTERCPF
jgi:hypothetical protein